MPSVRRHPENKNVVVLVDSGTSVALSVYLAIKPPHFIGKYKLPRWH